MDLLIDRVAGLDVHRDSVMACVRIPKEGKRTRASETRQFGTTTSELRLLASWLDEMDVTDVAMEATGIYWKPVFAILEHDFEVTLVNAAHMKNVPGRKTDVADAAWIAQLAEHGLLRASFIPPPDIRQLRNLTRYRRTLVNERTRVTQRLEKVLQDAGIKLTSVASTVLSKSGRAILEALIVGERDPAVLAELAKGRLRPKIPALREALEGRFDHHHAVIAAQGLAHVDGLERAIVNVTIEIDRLLEPHEWAIQLLDTIPGVDRKTAQVILAEIGVDMAPFPTAGHLASWAGVCPGNNESAGKRGKTTVRPGSPWLRQALVEAAWAAARVRNSYLSQRHARIRARRGKQRAVVATGHAILVASWHILSSRTPFAELGPDYYNRRHSPEAETRRLLRRLEALGHQVSITPAA
ncbi:MAG TPA: IS110 family transposase [Acidimicrobiales bacterium]|nr:IS110 family transposase [Acidimicrobiales bacterium]